MITTELWCVVNDGDPNAAVLLHSLANGFLQSLEKKVVKAGLIVIQLIMSRF